MTDKKTEALKLALEYLRDNQHYIADNERHAYVMEYNAFVERLEALAEQPADPFGIGGGLVAIKNLLSRDPCAHAKVATAMINAMLTEQPAQQEPITKETYLQELLEFMNVNDPSRWEIGFRNIVSILLGPKSSFEIADVVEMVRQLKQPAQHEPVAWIYDTTLPDGEVIKDWTSISHPLDVTLPDEGVHNIRPLYAAPQPSKPWVGLTKEDRYKAICPLYCDDAIAALAACHSNDEYEAIEAKLKKKNT